MENKKEYFKTCDNWPQHGIQRVVVNFDTNWCTGVDTPELSTPIYKDCCHFYEINKDGSKGFEVNFKEKHPKLLL